MGGLPVDPGQLAAVQSELNDAMKSVQAAVMRLETLGPEFSDALAVLRDIHRSLFRLDLALAGMFSGMEKEAEL